MFRLYLQKCSVPFSFMIANRMKKFVSQVHKQVGVCFFSAPQHTIKDMTDGTLSYLCPYCTRSECLYAHANTSLPCVHKNKGCDFRSKHLNPSYTSETSSVQSTRFYPHQNMWYFLYTCLCMLYIQLVISTKDKIFHGLFHRRLRRRNL